MTFEEFAAEVVNQGWWIQTMAQSGMPTTGKPAWFISVRRRLDNRVEHAEAEKLIDTMKSVLFNMKQERQGYAVPGVTSGYTGKASTMDDQQAARLVKLGLRPVRQHEMMVALDAMLKALEARNATGGNDRDDDL